LNQSAKKNMRSHPSCRITLSKSHSKNHVPRWSPRSWVNGELYLIFCLFVCLFVLEKELLILVGVYHLPEPQSCHRPSGTHAWSNLSFDHEEHVQCRRLGFFSYRSSESC
jgi:hypothetical protein